MSRVKLIFSLLFAASAVWRKGGPGAGAPWSCPALSKLAALFLPLFGAQKAASPTPAVSRMARNTGETANPRNPSLPPSRLRRAIKIEILGGVLSKISSPKRPQAKGSTLTRGALSFLYYTLIFFPPRFTLCIRVFHSGIVENSVETVENSACFPPARNLVVKNRGKSPAFLGFGTIVPLFSRFGPITSRLNSPCKNATIN